MIVPQIDLSVRYDMLEKHLKWRPEPTDEVQKKEYSNEAGAKSDKGWETARNWTVDQIRDHAFIKGLALSVGVYNGGHRHEDNLISGQMVGLDFEIDEKSRLPASEGLSAEELAVEPFVSCYATLIAPSASDTPFAPRARVIIITDRLISAQEYRNIVAVFKAKYPGRLDKKASDPVRFFFGSLPDPNRIYRLNNVLPVDDFLAEHRELWEVQKRVSTPRANRQESEGQTIHEALPTDRQVFRVYSMVKYVLDWHYDRRALIGAYGDMSFNTLVWAASVSSNRDRSVYELLRDHPIWQLDRATEADYQRFERNFHSTDVRHISVGTLYHYAWELGYEKYSPLDITEDTADAVIETTDFLSGVSEAYRGVLPQCLLGVSNTGTGKTEALESLLPMFRGKKAAIFAPTRNLCRTLASRIARFKPLLYLDNSNNIRESEALQKAAIVVLTPQQAGRLNPADYDFVWLEEYGQVVEDMTVRDDRDSIYTPDQIEGFMSFMERVQGFVWAVDATATMQTVADLRRYFPDTQVVYNRGGWTKANTVFLKSGGQLRRALLDSVENSDTAHIAVLTDTVGGAVGTMKLAELLRARGISHIVVNRNTQNRADVKALMADPNAEAMQYRVIIGSPTMLSGISITKGVWEVYLFGKHLTPRRLLQFANRFRFQTGLLVWTARTRELSGISTVGETLEELQRRYTALVQATPNSVVVERGERAKHRDLMYALSTIDAQAQGVRPEKFLARLFEGDKRTVTFAEDREDSLNAMDKLALKSHSELLESEKMENWQNYAPLDPLQPIPEDTTELQAYIGAWRAGIDRATIQGYDDTDNPRAIAEAYKQTSNLGVLEMTTGLVAENQYLQRALLDPDMPISAIRMDYAVKSVLTAVSILYPDGAVSWLSGETLAARAADFVGAVYDNAGNFNRDKRQRIDGTCTPPDLVTEARRILKILLSRVGLKIEAGENQRTEWGQQVRGVEISNLEQALYMLQLRARGRLKRAMSKGVGARQLRQYRPDLKQADEIAIMFPKSAELARTDAEIEAIDRYEALPAKAQGEIRDIMKRERVSFPEALTRWDEYHNPQF